MSDDKRREISICYKSGGGGRWSGIEAELVDVPKNLTSWHRRRAPDTFCIFHCRRPKSWLHFDESCVTVSLKTKSTALYSYALCVDLWGESYAHAYTQPSRRHGVQLFDDSRARSLVLSGLSAEFDCRAASPAVWNVGPFR